MQGVLERLQAMGQGCGEWRETSKCVLFHLVTKSPVQGKAARNQVYPIQGVKRAADPPCLHPPSPMDRAV